jgi:hypothetical protein
MGNPFGNMGIMQTGSQAFAQVITLVNFPQQQTAAIRGNPTTLKISDNFLGEETSNMQLFMTYCMQWAYALKYCLSCDNSMLADAPLLYTDLLRRHDAHFILDTNCLPKRGQKIEEVSWVYDHNQGKAVLGYEVLILGVGEPQGFYPLDFGCHFSRRKGKHYRAAQATGSTARRVKEAELSKLELSLQMLQRAVKKGVRAAYVLFDRWFTSPKFLKAIRSLGLHAIGRLKNDNVLYGYQGRWLTVAQLYRLKKSNLIWNRELQYSLATVAVTCANGLAEQIIFSKGYQEPEIDKRVGAKLSPKSSWAAFFSTDTSLTAPEVAKKFMGRWSIEVFFKEAKTMLSLGKDPSQSFQAQICAITLTFLRYNLLAFLKEQQVARSSSGELFHRLEQEMAPLSYMDKIVAYFRDFLVLSWKSCIVLAFSP